MLTELTTVKSRLALDPLTNTYDALLLRAIQAISARFDQETNRTLARTVDAQFEFPIETREILVPCYPIESVVRFEIKSSEAEGWSEQRNVDYLLRGGCFISLSESLANLAPARPNGQQSVGRVIYTGGYLTPGSAAVAAAVSLPADLEHAAIEQTAFWFQTRDELGVIRQWPHGGDYQQFVDVDLLPSVRETLSRYRRFVL